MPAIETTNPTIVQVDVELLKRLSRKFPIKIGSTTTTASSHAMFRAITATVGDEAAPLLSFSATLLGEVGALIAGFWITLILR